MADSPALLPDGSTGRGVLVVGRAVRRSHRRRIHRAVGPVARVADGRWWPPHDTRGPKVRLGIVWFVATILAAVWSTWALAVLFAAVAVVASLQAVAAHRFARLGPDRAAAVLMAASLPLAAATGLWGLAIGIVLCAILSAGLGLVDAVVGHTGVSAWLTVRCSLMVGIAAATPVVVRSVDLSTALVLVAFVGIYDSGDYLVGSGARNAIEGPLAGAIGVVVVTFSASVVEAPALDSATVWLLGVVTAIACPFGQMLASAVLPAPDSFAPALRRLDSLAVTGPAWLLILVARGGFF